MEAENLIKSNNKELCNNFYHCLVQSVELTDIVQKFMHSTHVGKLFHMSGQGKKILMFITHLQFQI